MHQRVRVRDFNWDSLSFTGCVATTLVVHLARPAALDDPIGFTIDYDGHIDNARGLTFIDERPSAPWQMRSMGETTENHRWLATYDVPNATETPVLERALPTLTHADTRAAVGRAMARIQAKP